MGRETRSDQLVRIPAGGVRLEGDLRVPAAARGVVVFAHGSGSSRLSTRNVRVAGVLDDAGFATLLFDLLTPQEDSVYENRFDIPRLAERLVDAARWVSAETGGLPAGLFGASTGAAAALVAAAELPNVRAVVSRGGRPDLAGDALERVSAPVLLVVGGADPVVIDLNRQAARHLRAHNELRIVEGATHLFEEPGALEQVSRLAADWFDRYLPAGD